MKKNSKWLLDVVRAAHLSLPFSYQHTKRKTFPRSYYEVWYLGFLAWEFCLTRVVAIEEDTND